MTLSKSDLVRRFGAAIESGNAALFVGAGLSSAASLPEWGGLLTDLRSEADVPGSLEDYPLVAEYIVDSVTGGRERLEKKILEAVGKSEVEPTEGHKIIAKTPYREIWTTNYDSLLERTVTQARVIYNEHDLLDREHGAPNRIIKMHGSASRDGREWIRKPVITRADYESYQDNFPRTWASLTATYLTRSTLFLGFSFADPNIGILLRLSRTLGDKAHRKNGDYEHFTVMRRPPAHESEKLRLHELRVKDLEKSGVGVCEIDDYNKLSEILIELQRRTRKPSVFVSGSWAKDDLAEDDARAICRKLGDDLVDLPNISVTSLAGHPATNLSFAFGEILSNQEKYDPNRIIFYFRQNGTQAPTMKKRIGTAIYFNGSEVDDVRKHALSECRAVIVVGGGDNTTKEVSVAREAGMPIIPLAITGGAAKRLYETHSCEQLFGQKSHEIEIEWNNLNTTEYCSRGAVKLLKKAMFLDD